MENWKEITNHPDYQVSDLGRIMSFKNNGARIMALQLDSDGYQIVKFRTGGKQYTMKVHRLVAGEFIENPNGYPQTNHKFGNKSDNRASELEWVSDSQNKFHAYKTGLKKSFKGQRTIKSKTVIQMDRNDNIVGIFKNVTEAEYLSGVNGTQISSCARGLKYFLTAGGYKWKYAC